MKKAVHVGFSEEQRESFLRELGVESKQTLDELLDELYASPPAPTPTPPTYSEQIAYSRHSNPLAAKIIDYSPYSIALCLVLWWLFKSTKAKTTIKIAAHRLTDITKERALVFSLIALLLLAAYSFRYEYTESRARHIRVNRWTDCTEIFTGNNGWKPMGESCD